MHVVTVCVLVWVWVWVWAVWVFLQLRGWRRRLRRQHLNGSVQRERGRVGDGDGRTVSGRIGSRRWRADIDPGRARITGAG